MMSRSGLGVNVRPYQKRGKGPVNLPISSVRRRFDLFICNNQMGRFCFHTAEGILSKIGNFPCTSTKHHHDVDIGLWLRYSRLSVASSAAALGCVCLTDA